MLGDEKIRRPTDSDPKMAKHCKDFQGSLTCKTIILQKLSFTRLKIHQTVRSTLKVGGCKILEEVRLYHPYRLWNS
jgi:hypothetical protein